MYNYKKVNICYDLIEKSSDLFEKFSINVQHFQLRKTLKSISFFFYFGRHIPERNDSAVGRVVVDGDSL